MCTKECDDAPPPLPSLPAPKSGRRRPPQRAPGVTTTIERGLKRGCVVCGVWWLF
uniref:Uncharacterized protein n=1 Tax=Oryza nivara TaxID=4536 RepID=A0A0E0G218_ORYNI